MKTLKEALFNKSNLSSCKRFLNDDLIEFYSYLEKSNFTENFLVLTDPAKNAESVFLFLPGDSNFVDKFINKLSKSKKFELSDDLLDVDTKMVIQDQKAFMIHFMNDEDDPEIFVDFCIINDNNGINDYFENLKIREIDTINNIFDFEDLFNKINLLLH